MVEAKSARRESQYLERMPQAIASREDRIVQLKTELRDHIRSLGDHTFLSVDWLKLAESLQQVANVASMETHLPGGVEESSGLPQQGKKAGGTLWDQEKDEMSVRILLEEGKLNLCLRILQSFKESERSESFHADIEAASKTFEVTIARVTERCITFEKSIGLLLLFAFKHVEALQILDNPSLIAHCSQVMAHTIKLDWPAPPVDVDRLQESLVVPYLYYLAERMEEINEDRIMELFVEHDIFNLMVNFMLKYHSWQKTDALESFVKFFHFIMSAEVFVTSPNDFISNSLKKKLVQLNGLFIDTTVKAIADRKVTQSLVDNLAKWKRSFPAEEAKE